MLERAEDLKLDQDYTAGGYLDFFNRLTHEARGMAREVEFSPPCFPAVKPLQDTLLDSLSDQAVRHIPVNALLSLWHMIAINDPAVVHRVVAVLKQIT